MRFFKYFTINLINLSVKAKLLSLLACFGSIFFIALITKVILPWDGYPMIVASMGNLRLFYFLSLVH